MLSMIELALPGLKASKQKELDAIGTEYKGICPFCKGYTEIAGVYQCGTEIMTITVCRDCKKILTVGYSGATIMNVTQSIKSDENSK